MNSVALRTMPVTSFSGRAVDAGWKWRDRTGQFHRPSDMETRHLFHTLRMIWNNFMPPEKRVGAVRLYSFGPHYTQAYLADAIARIGQELLGRSDLRASWRAELDQMATHVRGAPMLLAGRAK